MDIGFNIGTSKEAVDAVVSGVLEIMNARADQKTIRLGLKVLLKGVQPNNAMIQNCTANSAIFDIEDFNRWMDELNKAAEGKQ